MSLAIDYGRDAVAVVNAAAHGDEALATLLVNEHPDPTALACALGEIAGAALGALADSVEVPLEKLLASCGRWALTRGEES